MIVDDYHSMCLLQHPRHARLNRRARELAWTPYSAPALTALLDHIAEELAREYVRLMKAAAHDEGAGPSDPNREAA